MMKLLFENLQIYANLMLGLMLTFYILTQFVKTCRGVFIRVGISIQRQLVSHLDKTRPTALKIWSCQIFKKEDHQVKLNTSLQRAERKKMTASLMISFVLNASMCLKPLAASMTFVIVKKQVHISPDEIFKAPVEKRTR